MNIIKHYVILKKNNIAFFSICFFNDISEFNKIPKIIIWCLLNIIIIIVPVLVSVALLTLLERKIMAAIQRRRGPNIIGFFGLLQPFADGLKLLTKEFNIPKRSFDSLVIITPMLSLMFTCSCFTFVPLSFSYLSYSSSNISALYIMAISSLNIYSIIMAGWASKSAYAFLGSLRASAQFISYEVSLTLNIMSIFLISGSFDLSEIAYIQQETIANIFVLFPIFLLYLVGIISETNRTPFDLAEAESELVAGYGVEFSAVGFAYFFIAEYGSIILYCLLTLTFFFNGTLSDIFIPVIIFTTITEFIISDEIINFFKNSELFDFFSIPENIHLDSEEVFQENLSKIKTKYESYPYTSPIFFTTHNSITYKPYELAQDVLGNEEGSNFAKQYIYINNKFFINLINTLKEFFFISRPEEMPLDSEEVFQENLSKIKTKHVSYPYTSWIFFTEHVFLDYSPFELAQNVLGNEEGSNFAKQYIYKQSGLLEYIKNILNYSVQIIYGIEELSSYFLVINSKLNKIFKDFSFAFQVVIILIFFCYVRATYARYRYDQLMKLNWKNLLIISLALNIYITMIFYFVKIITA